MGNRFPCFAFVSLLWPPKCWDLLRLLLLQKQLQRKEAWPLLEAGDIKLTHFQNLLHALCCWGWPKRQRKQNSCMRCRNSEGMGPFHSWCSQTCCSDLWAAASLLSSKAAKVELKSLPLTLECNQKNHYLQHYTHNLAHCNESMGRLLVLDQKPWFSHFSKKAEDITVLQSSRSFLLSSFCSPLLVHPSVGLRTLRTSSSGCLCSGVSEFRNTRDKHHRQRESCWVSFREEMRLLWWTWVPKSEAGYY